MGTASHHLLVLGASSECAELLRGLGFDVEPVEQLPKALELLGTAPVDLVLLCLATVTASGEEALARIHALAPHVAVIMLTRPGDDELARKALQQGAQDYLFLDDLKQPGLAVTFDKAIERQRSQLGARHDQHLLETLMDRIPDAIYFKDKESRFLRISRSQARKFGLSDPLLAAGKTDADFFTDAHAKQARADELRVIKSGLPVVGIEEMETWLDGNVSYVSTTKMPLRDPAGRIVGSFGISRDITPRKEAELALAERTRQLRTKNQQIEEELKMARELQQAMLPQRFPVVSIDGVEDRALEFFSFYIPSGSVSGDFYDVVELPDMGMGMFICDVMGHDVRAALVTAMMRALVHDLSQAAKDPGELLAQINQGLAGVFRQTGATMFATAFYLVVDIANGEIRYASAAHPDALHLQRSRGVVEALKVNAGKRGPALGLFEKAAFPTCRRPLAVDDVILLFTDGLIEAEGANEEYYSQERLAAAFSRRLQMPAKEMVEAVLDEIRQFSGTGEFGDDVSLVGMEVKQLPRPKIS
jgi:phosphoserine phosphatase RsbU/P